MNDLNKYDENFFADLFESIQDPVYVCDRNLILTYVNNAFCKMSSLEKNSTLGTKLLTLFPELKDSITINTINEVLKTGFPKTIKTRYNFSDNNYSFELNVYPAKPGLLVMIRNISIYDEQSEMDVEKFKNTLDNMIEGCGILDKEYRYTYVNDVNARFAHMTRNEMLGKSVLELFPGFEQSSMFKNIKKTMDEETPLHFEEKFIYPDGSESWYEIRSIPIPEGLFMLSIDVTEKKEQERKLNQIQSILQKAEKLAQFGTFWIDYDNELRKENFSEGLYRIFGYEPGEIELNFKFLLSHVHPHDYPIIKNEFNINRKENESGKVSVRIIKKNGDERVIQAQSFRYFNAEGKPKRIVGSAIDISELTRALEEKEKHLQYSERRSRELNTILEAIPDAVLIGSTEGIQRANRSALELLGVDSIEELQLSIDKLNSKFELRDAVSREPLSVEQSPFAKALGGENAVGVVLIKNIKTGEDMFIRAASAPIIEEGVVKSAVIIETDITQTKKYEENIVNALKEKEVLLRELYHRTKNNMQVISSMLGLEASKTNDDIIVGILESMQRRIQTMALVHQKLYQSKNLSRIDLKDYIVDLIQLIKRGLISNHDNVEFKFELESIPVLIDIAVSCGLVINELVSNAIKHAFPDDKKGIISISTRKMNDKVELIINDNGVGFKKYEMREEKKLGLQIFKVIAEDQLQAEVKMTTSDDGVKWYILFDNSLYDERV